MSILFCIFAIEKEIKNPKYKQTPKTLTGTKTMRTNNIEQEILNANLAEMMNEVRPTAEQRRADLEAELGTFEDCLLDWIENQ